VKWTSLVLIIDGSNYETMSAANEDHYDPSQPQPMYWEAAVLGLALVALVLGSLGVVIVLCHTYYRSRVAREETRQMRGAQLYDSIVVRSDSAGSSDPGAERRKEEEAMVRMPGEMEPGGTMSKAMSYDVNPIYSL